MIDTKKYDGWLGGNCRAAVVVNAFAGRQWAVGDVEGLLTLDGGKRIDLFGNNPGFKSQPLSQQQVISTLQDYDVFVNTSLRSPIPASLLEAAAVGIPIVTTATCAIPEFFKDGINCLTFSTFEECLLQVDRLLADKQLRKTIGQAGRATIIERFNEQRYVADWNKVFQATKDSYNG
jgi:glycosyltransferase involved in cell wall biosynthesis